MKPFANKSRRRRWNVLDRHLTLPSNIGRVVVLYKYFETCKTSNTRTSFQRNKMIASLSSLCAKTQRNDLSPLDSSSLLAASALMQLVMKQQIQKPIFSLQKKNIRMGVHARSKFDRATIFIIEPCRSLVLGVYFTICSRLFWQEVILYYGCGK